MSDNDFEMYQRHLRYKETRILTEKKYKARNKFFDPNIGDSVLYSSFSKNDVLMNTGCGEVIKKVVQNEDRAQIFYVIKDFKTKKEVEVMTNSYNYPNDFVERMDHVSTEYFAGYDLLTKQVITDTIATYKSDAEEQMQRRYGENWKETKPYLEVRNITINVN